MFNPLLQIVSRDLGRFFVLNLQPGVTEGVRKPIQSWHLADLVAFLVLLPFFCNRSRCLVSSSRIYIELEYCKHLLNCQGHWLSLCYMEFLLFFGCRYQLRSFLLLAGYMTHCSKFPVFWLVARLGPICTFKLMTLWQPHTKEVLNRSCLLSLSLSLSLSFSLSLTLSLSFSFPLLAYPYSLQIGCPY